MVLKLIGYALKHWRKLNGHELINDVIQGVTFKDGARG
jgi:hypothetical protein